MSCSNIISPNGDLKCNISYVNEVKTLTIEGSDIENNKAVLEYAVKMGTPVIICAGKLLAAHLVAGSLQLVPGAEMMPYLTPAIRPILLCDHSKIKSSTMMPANLNYGKPALQIVEATPVKAINPELKEKQNNRELQAKELDAANIPDDTKKLIAAEYMRLCRLHPKWKNSKTMRKAGEKYSIKFEFE